MKQDQVPLQFRVELMRLAVEMVEKHPNRDHGDLGKLRSAVRETYDDLIGAVNR